MPGQIRAISAHFRRKRQPACQDFQPEPRWLRANAHRTGRDLSNLPYYIAFNRWKSACIVHGVYARYMEGKKSTEGIDLDLLKSRIDLSLELADEAIQKA